MGSRLDRFKNVSLKDMVPEKFKTKVLAEKNKKEEEQKTVKNNSYYQFHQNEQKNPHYFLSEELLVPRMNNTDTQRGNMFASHVSQLVHLKNPEFPKVFTNFENQVGEYSIAYKKAEHDYEVVAKVDKNEYNYTLIVRFKDDDGEWVYDVINFNHAHNITENYGYRVNDCIPDVKEGDKIKKGTWLYKSDNYDDDGNFAYGVNLKAVFLPYLGYTYEDGVVVSKSAAEKLTSFKTEKIMFSVNGNDVLLNLYGDKNNYQSFPHIGEKTGEKVLVASRRRDKRSILYDFQADHLKEIDPDSDEIIYTHGGKVVDINIYNNIPIAELRKKKDAFNQEVLGILESQYDYWKRLAAELEKIIPGEMKPVCQCDAKQIGEGSFKEEKKDPVEKKQDGENSKIRDVYIMWPKDGYQKIRHTDEFGYYWKLAHDNLNEDLIWRFDGKGFENFKMEFTILKENPLTPGCKITGRYGNKGIVAKIEDDEKMPMTENGEHAEVCLNSLGVINRCNPGQIIEQHINFMSDHVVKQIKETDDLSEKEDIFFEYLKCLNKEEYDYFDLQMILMNRAQKAEFFKDVEEKGIYVHQPPIFGNTTTEQFETIVKKHPEWVEPYKFVGIEKPLVMGDMYFIRLKHESGNKSSARSASNLNVKNLPAKSTLRKEHKIPYNNTPIRLGEMEVANLLLSKNGEVIEKLLKTYSTNEEARESLITDLLMPTKEKDGIPKDPLNMDIDIDPKDYPSISRNILEKYLNVLGYTLLED